MADPVPCSGQAPGRGRAGWGGAGMAAPGTRAPPWPWSPESPGRVHTRPGGPRTSVCVSGAIHAHLHLHSHLHLHPHVPLHFHVHLHLHLHVRFHHHVLLHCITSPFTSPRAFTFPFPSPFTPPRYTSMYITILRHLHVRFHLRVQRTSTSPDLHVRFHFQLHLH